MLTQHSLLSGGCAGMEYFSPNGCLSGADESWYVWQGYYRGKEIIFSRRLVGTTAPGPPQEVCVHGSNHSPSVGLVGETPTTVWINSSAGKSRVVSSVRRGETWSAPREVSPSREVSRANDGRIVALDTSCRKGSLWTVWCRSEAQQGYSVWAARCEEDGGVQAWADPISVVSVGAVHRPVICAVDNGAWVAWDVYDGTVFAVWAAFVGEDGTVSPAEKVSPLPEREGLVTPEAWQFAAAVAVDEDQTPHVAWLCSQDVQNEEGVVDQWPTARVAVQDGGAWHLIRDEEGSPDLASMAWGLLSWEGAGVRGYLGPRRRPLLMADPDKGVWLLWERKVEHDGPTTQTGGFFCGRHLSASGTRSARVGPPVKIAQGPRTYAPFAIDTANGTKQLRFAGRADPRESTADVVAGFCDMQKLEPLVEKGSWTDWQPVSLSERRPSRGERVQAHCADEGECELFWGDPHVHTTLSADAEGHFDELVYYARDKAGLDFAVFQDNDECYLFMTDSEYELYQEYVRRFHQDGDFVLLPAFEWTERGPNYRNHRTVIGARDGFPVLRFPEVEGRRIAALAARAREHGGILHLHHETWELSEFPEETNLEVCSGWANHMMLNQEYIRKVHEILRSGRRLGFVGGSDNHRRNPGMGGALTGVYARELSRSALHDAFRSHRHFATNGSRIALKVWVNDAFIGETTRGSFPPVIRWEVRVPEPPAEVRLIRDGQVVRSWYIKQEAAAGEFTDREITSGDHFYYLAVHQEIPWKHFPTNVAVAKGPSAWSSPTWVKG